MRLFVLRHEQRQLHDPTFWSPLTPLGKRNALYNVAPDVNTTVKPTHVYSSPLLRCIQTVAPYCAHHNRHQLICCEPSLYERVRDAPAAGETKMFHRSIFQFHSVFDDAEYSYLHPYMFREYTPHMPTTAIRWGETCQDVHDRVISFMRHIMQQHGQDADARVLLVSHQCVINVILGEAQDHPFQMGQLCEVDICEWMERAHS